MRLLKLQAEKNICEVLIPGFGILLLADVWLIAARSSSELTERISLGVLLVIFGLACWSWRKTLERLFLEGLSSLERLVEKRKVDNRGDPVSR